MKIGVDLDGVVFDSEEELRVYSELYDFIELKNNSHKNNKELKSRSWGSFTYAKRRWTWINHDNSKGRS